MLGAAYYTIVIKSGVNYAPKDKESPIYRLHCIKTNEHPVKIKTLGDSIIEYPSGSFMRGHVYDLYVKQMWFEKGDEIFIGYKAKSKPYGLII